MIKKRKTNQKKKKDVALKFKEYYLSSCDNNEDMTLLKKKIKNTWGKIKQIKQEENIKTIWAQKNTIICYEYKKQEC